MVEDISERLRFFSKDTKRWRVYADPLRRHQLSPRTANRAFRDALEEHMSTGLNVSAVAVIDVHRIYETFGTKNAVRGRRLRTSSTSTTPGSNSFEWFVRLCENGRLKSEEPRLPARWTTSIVAQAQPGSSTCASRPKQFADARADVESDFGILVKKNFVAHRASTPSTDSSSATAPWRCASPSTTSCACTPNCTTRIDRERLLERRQRRGASRQRHRLQHQARRHGIRRESPPRWAALLHRQTVSGTCSWPSRGRTRPHRDRRVGRHLRAELHRR
ncbi:MAG: hypothetical protein ACLUNV_08180 [Sutterella wadsworthensis]